MNNTLKMNKKYDEQFIEELKKFSIIYDHNHVDYKKKELREKAWLQLAAQFKTTPALCKSRWKNLRDTYKRVRRRQEENPYHRRVHWNHFDQLKFLENVAHLRPSSSSSSPSFKKRKTIDCTAEVSDEDDITDIMDYDPLESSQERDEEAIGEGEMNDLMQRTVDDPVEANFLSFLNKTSDIIAKVSAAPSTQPSVEKHKTVELFEFLARKAIHANLPDRLLLELESKVFQLVNETIAKKVD